GNSPVGSLDTDLAVAARKALELDPKACRDYALEFSWAKSAEQFLKNLDPFPPEKITGQNPD
ncbi:MAG: hypothetical protein MI743_10320, partial [Sneathiellales bacterium]|nr:hypothetical protein [Sneathiellales bacterium]